MKSNAIYTTSDAGLSRFSERFMALLVWEWDFQQSFLI